MDLSYSEEQELLRASAERFLAEEYSFAERQKAAQSELGYSAEIWTQFAELGWLALPLPEACGGLGGGAVDLGILMETFGKALVLEPYFATVALGAAIIAAVGDETQQASILPAVAEGRVKLAFAHADAVGTTAQREGNGWRLWGRKGAVAWGGAANHLVISAGIGDGVGLFLVPSAAKGVDIQPYPLVDGTRAADVTLAGVSLGADALLGGNECAQPAIDAVVDRAIGALAWDAVGALSTVLDATVDYAKTRVQFGQPIAKFQALQHRMAEMAVLREEARALALLASLKSEASPDERARAASAAKVKVGRAARRIAEEAVQMHGGMGVTDELNIGAYLKRILVFDLSFGSVEHHLDRYGSLARGMLAEAA
jgi:alkylation response protein AidB-like acyl-CoA dehydrogenase